MRIEDYVNDILIQLGYPVVEIEIEEYIPKIVDLAFREVKAKITDIKSVTVPFSNKIHFDENVKDETNLPVKISSVVYITRGNSPYITNVTDNDALFMANLYSSTQSQQMSFSDYYTRSLLYNQLKNTISTDLDFTWDKPNKDLYISCNFPKPQVVTINYIPDYEYIEQISEPFWEDIIRRLSLALCKQSLGRIRSKYTVQSASYELDGETLLSESSQELSEIRSFLQENSDLIFPID